jgi:hypothetical protein
MANFKIQHEVTNGQLGDWHLCFQFGSYHYDDNTSEDGYRFIWRKDDNSLQAARGQARIPSKKDIFELLAKASSDGWF